MQNKNQNDFDYHDVINGNKIKFDHIDSNENYPDGRYQFIEKIGEGSFAWVAKYKDHSKMNRVVAIKVLKPDPDKEKNERNEARFYQEVNHIAKLSIDCPNIVTAYDTGWHYINKLDNKAYSCLIMEYCEGGSLREILDREKLFNTEDEVISLGIQLSEALIAVHGAPIIKTQKNKDGTIDKTVQTIIHQDIKPDNILFNSKGIAKLSDFGIARTQDSIDKSISTGKGRRTAGTPPYMPYEQLIGNSMVQSDIYAVGFVLFEVLTGKQPFTYTQIRNVYDAIESDGLEKGLEIWNNLKSPKMPPKISKGLKKVIEKCLAKDSDDRYKSARELQKKILELVDVRTVSSHNNRFIDKRSPRLWVSIATLIILGIVTGIAVIGGTPPNEEISPLTVPTVAVPVPTTQANIAPPTATSVPVVAPTSIPSPIPTATSVPLIAVATKTPTVTPLPKVPKQFPTPTATPMIGFLAEGPSSPQGIGDNSIAYRIHSFLDDGRVLIATSNPESKTSTIISIFDPATNKWDQSIQNYAQVPVTLLSQDRDNVSVTNLLNGTILFVGWYSPKHHRYQPIVYDVANNTWTETGPLIFSPSSNQGESSILLENGQVMFISDNVTNTYIQAGVEKYEIEWGVQIFNPETNEFYRANSPNHIASKYGNFAAFSRSDGNVLVFGNGGDAEIFDPITGIWSDFEFEKCAIYPWGTMRISGGKLLSASPHQVGVGFTGFDPILPDGAECRLSQLTDPNTGEQEDFTALIDSEGNPILNFNLFFDGESLAQLQNSNFLWVGNTNINIYMESEFTSSPSIRLLEFNIKENKEVQDILLGYDQKSLGVPYIVPLMDGRAMVMFEKCTQCLWLYYPIR